MPGHSLQPPDSGASLVLPREPAVAEIQATPRRDGGFMTVTWGGSGYQQPSRGVHATWAALVGVGETGSANEPIRTHTLAQPPQFLGEPASSMEATLC